MRLYGHAGADVESAYSPMAEIEAQEAQDPLLFTAAHLLENGIFADEIIETYQSLWTECETKADAAASRPKLQNAAEVMAAIVPPKRDVPKRNAPSDDELTEAFGAADMRALEQPQPMNKLVNLGLCDLMLSHPEIVMAGEDIGRKGGV